MPETSRLRPPVKRSPPQPRLTALGLGLVAAAFGAALAWWWWPPAVLAGYVLLTANTVLLARRGLR